MRILKNIILVLVVFIISYYTSVYFGDFYQKVFNDPGTWIDVRGIVGLPLAYTFFLFLLFTAFGGKGKYWWMGIAVLPALAFEVYFDLPHIYFPIALGIVGWVIGFGVQKITGKFLN